MKNQGRHRHLRVDWVGEWFTVTGLRAAIDTLSLLLSACASPRADSSISERRTYE